MSTFPHELVERVAEEVMLDPYGSISATFVMVIDADALLSSIDNHCRTGRRSRLLRIASSKASCVYAGDHVYSEVYRGFKRMALTTSSSVDELKSCFEEHYLPVFRWVETDGDGTADQRLQLVTDDTDVPTAVLASLIAPCLVLSEDKALRRPGFAPSEWRLAAGYGVEVVEGCRLREEAGMAFALPAVAVVGGGIELGRIVRLPWWASLALLGAGGYALLRRPERRRTLGERVWPFIEAMVAMMAEAAAREQAGVRGLKGLMLQPATPPTLKQQVATVLARTREPLLAREVHELIERHFDGPLPTADSVRAVLRTSPEFRQRGPYRWELGRIRDPRRDATAFSI